MLNDQQKSLLIQRISEVNPASLNRYRSENLFYELNIGQLYSLAEKLKNNKKLKQEDFSFQNQVDADFFRTCADALVKQQSKNAEELESFKKAHPKKGLFSRPSPEETALKQNLNKNIDDLLSTIDNFNYGQFKYVIAQMYKQSDGKPSQIYVPTATEHQTLELFVKLKDQYGIKFLDDSTLEDKIYRDFKEYVSILEQTETERDKRDPVFRHLRSEGLRGKIVDKNELIANSREEMRENEQRFANLGSKSQDKTAQKSHENEQISAINGFLDELNNFLANPTDISKNEESKKQIFQYISRVQECQLLTFRAMNAATDPEIKKGFEEAWKKTGDIQKKFETNSMTAKMYDFKKTIDQANLFLVESSKKVASPKTSWGDIDTVYAETSQLVEQVKSFSDDEYYKSFSAITEDFIKDLNGLLQKCNDAKLEKTYIFIKTAREDLRNGCSANALSSIKNLSATYTEKLQEMQPDPKNKKRLEEYLKTLNEIAESCNERVSPASDKNDPNKSGSNPNSNPSQFGD